jgi:Cysteine-rich secretory protein family
MSALVDLPRASAAEFRPPPAIHFQGHATTHAAFGQGDQTVCSGLAALRRARRLELSESLPRTLRLKKMKLKPLSIVIFALGLALPAIDRARADQFAVDSDKICLWIWKQTNAFREANGVPRLILDPTIVRVAKDYADFLARKNVSGHKADGCDPHQRVAAGGIENCGVSENVCDYWSAPDIAPWETVAARAMELWKQSKGHRENLLRARATRVGIGAAGWKHDGKNYYKIVQVFIDDCIPPRRPAVESASKDK